MHVWQGPLCVYVSVSVCMRVCVCVSIHYRMCSAGKLGISGRRFQARSAMKAQLRDESAAAAHRRLALIH